MRALTFLLPLPLVTTFAVGCDEATPTSPDVDGLNPQLAVIDRVEAIYLSLTRVDIHYTDGSVITDVVPGLPAVYDLLRLQDGVLAGLGIASLPAGLVSEIRLIVHDAEVTSDGVQFPLFVPGSKVKFLGEFDTTMTIDVGFQFDENEDLTVNKKGNVKLKRTFEVLPV